MQYQVTVELSAGEIETLLESLRYSTIRVEGSQGTPDNVREENLARLDTVAAKLRQAMRGKSY